MLGFRSQFGSATRPVSRRKAIRGVHLADDGSDDGEPQAEPEARGTELPPDFERLEHVARSGRAWYTYKAPDGKILRSLVAAWSYHVSIEPPSPYSSPGLPSTPREDLRNFEGRPDRHRPATRRGGHSREAGHAGPDDLPEAEQISSSSSIYFPDDLESHVTAFERPSSRKAPAVRQPSA